MHDPARAPAADENAEGGIDLFAVFDGWRRQRGRIFLLASAGAVAAAVVVVAVYVLRPARQETSLTFRLLFPGVEKGQYPNGAAFIPTDIVATPVLEEVYRRDELARFLRFDQFKDALAVFDDNPALNRLRREYQDRLSARTLTTAERDKLENAYESKLKALQNGEFTLVARLEGRLESWPPPLSGKVLEDALTVWAEQSRSRGVFHFDVSTFSDNILPRPPFMEDYPILLDRLRVALNRILNNLRQLSAVPGAGLIRAGDRDVSIGELQVALEDDLHFKLGMIEAPVYAMGFFRNPLLTNTYIREQMFRLQLASDEARNRADAIKDALTRYAASRPGSARASGNATSIGGSNATTATNGTISPQISDSFLDQVVELSNQGADVSFRQDLSRKLIDADGELAGIESERQIYERILQGLGESEAARPALNAEDRGQWQNRVDDQITAMLAGLKRNLKDLNALNQEIAQQSLQPSLIYTVVEPLRQERVSPVSMRTVVLAIGCVYLVYLGICLVSLTWRNMEQQTAHARTPNH